MTLIRRQIAPPAERYPAISVAIAAYSTPALRAATRTTLDQS
jgi:hypothetical protein